MEQAEPFYQLLKQLRVAQGFEIADIANATRIDPRFIEALEEGEFDLLPMTYVRLFLRSYCEFVGADFEESLIDLEAATGETRREDLPSYAESISTQRSEVSVHPGQGPGGDQRSGMKLRQDLITGGAVLIFLVLLGVFAKRAYQEPRTIDVTPTARNLFGSPATPSATVQQPTTQPTVDLSNGAQPIIPLESSYVFNDADFTQDRIIANVQEKVRLTPPVRLTLMARDNLVLQPIRDGATDAPFNMTVAKAQIWTVDAEMILRTTGIHLLRGDINGTPINFGQAQGIGTLRVTPTGVYEVSAYLTQP